MYVLNIGGFNVQVVLAKYSHISTFYTHTLYETLNRKYIFQLQ